MKAIVGMSYDSQGNIFQTLESIRNSAAQEAARSSVTNHYFQRAEGSPETLKFNYCVSGIPISAYVMMNMMHSGLDRVAFVGDELMGKVLREFRDAFTDARDRFRYVHEGAEWSLANTCKRGKDALQASPDEQVLICAGDLIHATDVDSMHPETSSDLEMQLNIMQNIYGERFDGDVCPYSRRYHMRMRDGGLVKEQNWWVARMHDGYMEAINALFGARKTKKNNAGILSFFRKSFWSP